eukprot:CAMPEP_0201541144 /NCGR_PEP_ID=MMETSP0161_2-20130828/71322_1 /ASSEMBLY_ACC=CAM_ASM_000251 /TAXON_ID=180227 /ORGANISM="Neoparamoeba aestuarina, Strain SoJaBio B1-5/56/2" /LENGTH=355 /DNA_ID=CAMNT_0047948659 /DNA_START=1136 /DNA_END=2203 /DNA_ORIENTATION=-
MGGGRVKKEVSFEEQQAIPRRNISRACLPCRRSHLRCDLERPCSRCCRKGIQHECVDPPPNLLPKKRKRSDAALSEYTEMVTNLKEKVRDLQTSNRTLLHSLSEVLREVDSIRDNSGRDNSPSLEKRIRTVGPMAAEAHFQQTGLLSSWSDEFIKLFGYSADELADSFHFYMLFSDGGIKGERKLNAKALLEHKMPAIVTNVTLCKKNGEEIGCFLELDSTKGTEIVASIRPYMRAVDKILTENMANMNGDEKEEGKTFLGKVVKKEEEEEEKVKVKENENEKENEKVKVTEKETEEEKKEEREKEKRKEKEIEKEKEKEKDKVLEVKEVEDGCSSGPTTTRTDTTTTTTPTKEC